MMGLRRVILIFGLLTTCLFTGLLLAGDLSPFQDPPDVTYYSLADVKSKIEDLNYSPPDHFLSPSQAVAPSGPDLTDLWDSIPVIDASKLLESYSLMGVTGTIAEVTLSPDSLNMPGGYYSATTLDAVDSDLSPENIRSGSNVFGIIGEYNFDSAGESLEWESPESGTQGGWSEAVNYCSSLGEGWRLPTASELLQASIDYESGFSSLTYYWSSTQSPDSPFCLRSTNAVLWSGSLCSNVKVRCVR